MKTQRVPLGLVPTWKDERQNRARTRGLQRMQKKLLAPKSLSFARTRCGLRVGFLSWTREHEWTGTLYAGQTAMQEGRTVSWHYGGAFFLGYESDLDLVERDG